jgi:hypothetical protein
MGRIVLYFYFIENVEAAKPTDVARPAADDPNVLSEKALQKCASTPGDVLTHQARYGAYSHLPLENVVDALHSFAAPECHDTISYNHIKTLTDEPFVTFTFYYRSTGG